MQTKHKKILVGVGAAIVLGGSASLFLQGTTATDVTEVDALEKSYMDKNGRPLQIIQGNKLPPYEQGTVSSKLGKNVAQDIEVSIEQYPNGTWGYKAYQIPSPQTVHATTTP